MIGWKTTVTSSVGKKLMMAVTGLCFCGFLAVHLLGNLSIYIGPHAFNAYADTLQAMKEILRIAEAGLIVLALVHIITGLTLFFQNRAARPVRYQVSKSAGGRTIGSMTMPYTGLLILCFLIFHLINFTFADKTGTTLFDLVAGFFQHALYIGFYVAAVICGGIHVSHGFWSAFQTLGLNHPKYMPAIKALSVLLAVVVAVGFGSLPIFLSLTV